MVVLARWNCLLDYVVGIDVRQVAKPVFDVNVEQLFGTLAVAKKLAAELNRGSLFLFSYHASVGREQV